MCGIPKPKKKKKAELTDTRFPAFIESGAALGLAPVHRFLAMPVGSAVTDPKGRNECSSHTLVQEQDRTYSYTFYKHSGITRKEGKNAPSGFDLSVAKFKSPRG